jgi:hypothetical protein
MILLNSAYQSEDYWNKLLVPTYWGLERLGLKTDWPLRNQVLNSNFRLSNPQGLILRPHDAVETSWSWSSLLLVPQPKCHCYGDGWIHLFQKKGPCKQSLSSFMVLKYLLHSWVPGRQAMGVQLPPRFHKWRASN